MTKRNKAKRIVKPKNTFVKQVIGVFAKSPYTAFNFKQISSRLNISGILYELKSKLFVWAILEIVTTKRKRIEYKLLIMVYQK